MSNHIDPRRATRREWIGLAVIALPCVLYSMDLTVLNLAVPHVAADLRPSSARIAEVREVLTNESAGFLDQPRNRTGARS
jgi:DHA2 family multidrug resistance protein-like MFS transporter